MKKTTLTLTALLAAAAFGLSACGNATVPATTAPPVPASSAPSQQQSQPPASQEQNTSAPEQSPSPSGQPVSETIAVGEQTIIVPKGMKFPEGVTFTQITSDQTGGVAIMTADPAQVFSFYRKHLREVGYLPATDLSSGLLTCFGGGWGIQVTKTSAQEVMVGWSFEQGDDEPTTSQSSAEDEPSDEPTSTEESQQPSTSAPIDDGTGKGDTISVGGTELKDVPTGMTFPKGTKIANSQLSGATGRVSLSAPSGAELVAHFRATLPKAGFTVTAQGDHFVSATGKGWTIMVSTAGTNPAVSWSYDG